MNERYLFRGKSIDGNNFWITGHLAFLGIHGEGIAKYPIIYRDFAPPRDYQNSYTVIPATVGQCTGLRDKNGTLIFEGDVVTWVDSDDTARTDIVKWMFGGLCLCNAHYTVGSYIGRDIEVIDNIHDQPQTWRNCTTCKHGDKTPCKLNRVACGDDYKYWE